MRITREWLEAGWACSDQVAIFAAEWPDGVDVNLETLLRAARLELNLDWLARQVLKEALWVEYLRQAAPLRMEFYRQVAPIIWEFIQSQEAQGQDGPGQEERQDGLLS